MADYAAKVRKAIRDTLRQSLNFSNLPSGTGAAVGPVEMGSHGPRKKAGATMMAEQTNQVSPSASERRRALDILAKSLYRELTAQGYDQKHIVNLATALLGQVTAKA